MVAEIHSLPYINVDRLSAVAVMIDWLRVSQERMHEKLTPRFPLGRIKSEAAVEEVHAIWRHRNLLRDFVNPTLQVLLQLLQVFATKGVFASQHLEEKSP